MYRCSGLVNRSRIRHIGTPGLIMHTLHVGPLMLLSCALGMAASSWLFDAMVKNKYALRYSAQKLIDIRTNRIHHLKDNTAGILKGKSDAALV